MDAIPERKASRARRRRQDRLVAARRRERHAARIHPGPGPLDCTCERARTYFTKRSGLGCTCRKRRRGQPRVSPGLCKDGDRGRVYRWRRRGRELADLLRGEPSCALAHVPLDLE